MSNACPACGKKYSLPAGAIGRAFVCKRCGLKLQITEHGLSIPSVPDAGPPIPPPRPIDHGAPPTPDLDVEPVDLPRPTAPVPAAYPPPVYFPDPPAPVYPDPPPRPRFAALDEDDEDDPPPPRQGPRPGNVLI